jgi:hypothetical protein
VEPKTTFAIEETMNINFFKKLKDIFASNEMDSYYSNLAMEIFRQSRIESAALALNENILPEDTLLNIYGEKVMAEARIFRCQMDPRSFYPRR